MTIDEAGPSLNKTTIDALVAPEKGATIYWFVGARHDRTTPPAPRGFGIRITAAGVKSYVLDFRLKGRQHRVTIGRVGEWPIKKAVGRAIEIRQQVDRGENPLPGPKITTVGAMLDKFMTEHVTGKLRSEGEYRDTFDRLVKPKIGNIGIHDLRRSDIMSLLGQIAVKNGEVMSDRTLSYLRSACNWWALRDDEFTPPFVRGMMRTKPALRARQRILSDDELRAVWHATEKVGMFGAYVRVLLLTGQRRDEVAGMRWNELGSDGVWAIPANRYKTARDHFLPLSQAVLAIVNAQTHRNDTDLVFPSRVLKPISGFSQARKKLAKITGPLPVWTLHDLRRSARSLMARAGVNADVAERVLGHVVPGVRGVYDRHSYATEKREALERLAALVGKIVEEPEIS